MGQKSPNPMMPNNGNVLHFYSGGYNGIVSKRSAAYNLWAASSNVYRVQNGVIRRARFANIIQAGATYGLPATTSTCSSLYAFSDPSQTLLLSDWSNNKLYTHGAAQQWQATERVHPFYNSGDSHMAGPWSRVSQFNVCYEMNGLVRMKSSGDRLLVMKDWGIKKPADPPTVTLTTLTAGQISAVALSVNVESGGSGYTIGDILTVPGGDGTGRVQVLTLDGSGIIGTNSLSYGGWGYAVSDVLTISGGNQDATITVTGISTTGVIQFVGLITPGTGYTVGDTLTLSGGGANATLQVTSVDASGGVLTFVVTANGTGYVINTTNAVTGGTGTGAVFSVGAGGTITTYTLTTKGTGYITGTALAFNSPSKGAAIITITTVVGGIVDLGITVPGTTYTVTTSNALTGGTGTGALMDITAIAAGITKAVGRSYKWAWADPNTLPRYHVSSPSPPTILEVYANQVGIIDCVAKGTIAVAGTTAVVGTGTLFSQDMVGQQLWSETNGNLGFIASVTDATHLTLKVATANTNNTKKFQVFDSAATSLDVILYATANGGATYFRVQASNFVATATTLAASGLEFNDSDNSEPPDGQFQLQTTEEYNDPPPIGKYCAQYQSRILVFGVPNQTQTIFYSNIEKTLVGVPTESFAPLNQFTIPAGFANVAACGNVPTGLIIFSDQLDMFKLSGLLSDNTVSDNFAIGSTIQRLPYKYGCINQFTVLETPIGLYWITPEKQVVFFNDLNTPQIISLPVQDILYTNNGLSKARMKYYRDAVNSFVAIAIPFNAGTTNTKLLVFDINAYTLTGDMDWYIFDVACDSLETIFDGFEQLLVGSGVDKITNLMYNGNAFKVGQEMTVNNAYVKFHAVGNDSAPVIKQLKWVRFHPAHSPSQIITDGWQFQTHAFDDDAYYFSPSGDVALTQVLVPGTTNYSDIKALEYGPGKFFFGGNNSVTGRRIQFEVDFPKGQDFFDLDEITWEVVPLPAR